MRRKFDMAAALAASQSLPAAELTLAELVRAFQAERLDDSDLRLRKWMPAFGHRNAWDILTEDIETACQSMVSQGGYAPASANRDVGLLGSVYRWARQKKLTPRGFRSPTLGVQRFAEPIRRVHVPADRIEALKARSLAVPDRRFGAFVHLLLDTGARKSELLERIWGDVDLDAGTIMCSITKTGVPRVLHFQPATAELMRRRWPSRHPEKLLFEGRVPGQPVNYRSTWKHVTQAVKLEGVHLHDLRHVVAAELLRSDVTAPVAAQVLGHSSQILMRRYGHLQTADLRAAQLRRWEPR